MTLSVAQRQNIVFSGLILLSFAAGIFCYQFFERKWVIYRDAEKAYFHHDYPSAVTLYKRSFDEGLKTPSAFSHLAASYVSIGNFQEGIKWYKSYLEIYPDDIEARQAYADVLKWNGNFKEAQEQYQTILEFHEKNTP